VVKKGMCPVGATVVLLRELRRQKEVVDEVG
jgi:hypothetical protein